MMQAPIPPANGASSRNPRFDRRRLLEARANAVRARLSLHLDDLRGRLADLQHPAMGLTKRPVLLLAASGATAIVVGCGTGYVCYRMATRRSRARVGGWAGVFSGPEKVTPPSTAFFVPTIERGLAAALVTALSVVTKHFLEQALDGVHTRPVVRAPTEPDPFPSTPRLR